MAADFAPFEVVEAAACLSPAVLSLWSESMGPSLAELKLDASRLASKVATARVEASGCREESGADRFEPHDECCNRLRRCAGASARDVTILRRQDGLSVSEEQRVAAVRKGWRAMIRAAAVEVTQASAALEVERDRFGSEAREVEAVVVERRAELEAAERLVGEAAALMPAARMAGAAGSDAGHSLLSRCRSLADLFEVPLMMGSESERRTAELHSVPPELGSAARTAAVVRAESEARARERERFEPRLEAERERWESLVRVAGGASAAGAVAQAQEEAQEQGEGAKWRARQAKAEERADAAAEERARLQRRIKAVNALQKAVRAGVEAAQMASADGPDSAVAVIEAVASGKAILAAAVLPGAPRRLAIEVLRAAARTTSMAEHPHAAVPPAERWDEVEPGLASPSAPEWLASAVQTIETQLLRTSVSAVQPQQAEGGLRDRAAAGSAAAGAPADGGTPGEAAVTRDETADAAASEACAPASSRSTQESAPAGGSAERWRAGCRRNDSPPSPGTPDGADPSGGGGGGGGYTGRRLTFRRVKPGTDAAVSLGVGIVHEASPTHEDPRDAGPAAPRELDGPAGAPKRQRAASRRPAPSMASSRAKTRMPRRKTMPAKPGSVSPPRYRAQQAFRDEGEGDDDSLDEELSGLMADMRNL